MMGDSRQIMNVNIMSKSLSCGVAKFRNSALLRAFCALHLKLLATIFTIQIYLEAP